MARLNAAAFEGSDRESSFYGDLTPASTRRASARTRTTATFSPLSAEASDKENQGEYANAQKPATKSRGAMAASRLPTPTSGSRTTPRAQKRRRLGEHNVPMATQIPQVGEAGEFVDLEFYDPYQDAEQRRAVRKGLRDLHRELQGQYLYNEQLASVRLTYVA